MTVMHTYVEYIIPSKRIPAGEAIVHRVDDRDITKLDIPPNAHEFYFFDSPIDSSDPHDAQNEQHNCSAFYLIADKLITSDTARDLRKKPAAKNKSAAKPQKKILGMTQSELRESFWEISLKNHTHFIVTRQGALKPVRKDNIVINDKCEQLYPVPLKPFSPALEEKMAIKKPIRLKTRPPQSP